MQSQHPERLCVDSFSLSSYLHEKIKQYEFESCSMYCPVIFCNALLYLTMRLTFFCHRFTWIISVVQRISRRWMTPLTISLICYWIQMHKIDLLTFFRPVRMPLCRKITFRTNRILFAHRASASMYMLFQYICIATIAYHDGAWLQL